MKNLQNALLKIEQTTLKVSGEKINQTQRNEMKSDILRALVSDLAELGFSVAETADGAVVVIENETANVFISFDGTVKNLDFDLDGAVAEHQESINAKLERERLATEKRERLAKEKAEKAEKTLKKA